jgi:hypothetical protein
MANSANPRRSSETTTIVEPDIGRPHAQLLVKGAVGRNQKAIYGSRSKSDAHRERFEGEVAKCLAVVLVRHRRTLSPLAPGRRGVRSEPNGPVTGAICAAAHGAVYP